MKPCFHHPKQILPPLYLTVPKKHDGEAEGCFEQVLTLPRHEVSFMAHSIKGKVCLEIKSRGIRLNF